MSFAVKVIECVRLALFSVRPGAALDAGAAAVEDDGETALEDDVGAGRPEME